MNMPNIIVTVETNETDLVELAEIFEINRNVQNGIIQHLAGIILLKPSISQKYRTIAQDSQGEWLLQSNLPSSKVSIRLPHNPHANHARFIASNLQIKYNHPIKIYLEDDSRKRELIFNIQLQASENNNDNLNLIKDKVISLTTEKNREQEQYIVLRQSLDSIDKYNRNVDWFETSVLLNSLFKEKPGITFRQMEKIKKLYVNNISEWQKFTTNLYKLIYPLSINSHGYSISLSNRNGNKVWSDIAQLQLVFEKMNFECFINSGTLLGAIRESALIGYDDDVDLAIILKGKTFSEVANEWIKLKNRLNNMGLLTKTPLGKSSIHCKIGTAGGASVDLFPAWIVDNCVYIWPHTCGEICTLDLLPLKSITLNKNKIKVPQSPEKILCLNYGTDWHIPDSSFKFDWKSATKKFDQFISSLRLLESKDKK